jgi:hypothetical protein
VDWNTQIMIKDQTSARNTITLEKFAKRVAIAICKFLDVSMSQSFFTMIADIEGGQEAQRVHGSDPNWQVGNGGITKEQVILIGVVHVSQGSWQPILQLNHYILSRSLHLPGLI